MKIVLLLACLTPSALGQGDEPRICSCQEIENCQSGLVRQQEAAGDFCMNRWVGLCSFVSQLYILPVQMQQSGGQGGTEAGQLSTRETTLPHQSFLPGDLLSEEGWKVGLSGGNQNGCFLVDSEAQCLISQAVPVARSIFEMPEPGSSAVLGAGGRR